MSLDYESKTWAKEVTNFNKYKKEVRGIYNSNEINAINSFINSRNNDYLRLYSRLFGTYRQMATVLYFENINNKKCIDFSYLSGMALIYTKIMYDNDIKTELNRILENRIQEIDFALYEMISCNEVNVPFLREDDNNLISLVLYQKYENAKAILSELPDDVDESREVYYVRPVFLKNIYLSIVNHDEKMFNDELTKRIKKYRKNMVGYSTIIDVVSIALIKMAKLAGINCTIDVIEIPKMFFDESYVIDKETIKLPFYDEFLKLNLV